MGDLCEPLTENQFILDKLASVGKPVYHMLGNHDCDVKRKEDVLSFFKLPNSFYSFSYGSVKFIVLDACYMQDENGIRDYLGIEYDRKTMTYPFLPEWELSWLEKELEDSYPYFVILSHHSLQNPFGNRGVANRREIWKKLKNAEKKGKQILLCMNGHDHDDSIVMRGKTCCFTLNASSYIWLPDEYEHFFYPKKLHERYPLLKNILLYEKTPFAIIAILEDGTVSVSGMEGYYRDCSPQELGVDQWNGRKLSSRISSFQIQNGQLVRQRG